MNPRTPTSARGILVHGCKPMTDALVHVAGHLEDAQAVNQVFEQLTPDEKAILAHDAHQGAIRLTDSVRIDSPAYPELIRPLENLTRFARQAVAGELTPEMVLELEGMRRGP